MKEAPHRAGIARSGDVDVFFRLFGNPGATPIVILHGANYYDSYDWIGVASALAGDRQVAAIDSRGYGQSGWSPSKDYSHDAHVGDVLAVADHLGWSKTVPVVHSRGGYYGMLFATHYPERVAALVMIDSVPAIGIGHPGAPLVTVQSIGKSAKIFPTMEQALAATGRHKHAPPGSPAHARLEMIVTRVESGFILGKRDPDYANPIPLVKGNWPTRIAIDVDLWRELTKVRVPALFVRALQSKAGYPMESIDRLKRDYPKMDMLDVDSGHDVAAGAPDALIAGVKNFLHTRLDRS